MIVSEVGGGACDAAAAFFDRFGPRGGAEPIPDLFVSLNCSKALNDGNSLQCANADSFDKTWIW
jgi:hypothetical protein